MASKSLGNPFDGDSDLRHGANCQCEICAPGLYRKRGRNRLADYKNTEIKCEMIPTPQDQQTQSRNPIEVRKDGDTGIAAHDDAVMSSEAMMERAIESAVVRSVFAHNEISRRSFAKMLGAGSLAAAISAVFPMDKAKAAIMDTLGKPEKTKLNVGFVPITCATPIIMAKPLGFYEKYGLDVEVIKTAGWAVARDKSLNKEYDASHMLTPMPLAITMGAGSTAVPFLMPAVENINGQAIVLHNDHKDKHDDPSKWKGFKFGVPFEYSMHNFLLRYYVAEFGLDPDKDIQIRVVPPPEMVANLRAGNLDGYLSPDPFNQRAVWEKVGFIHKLTKDIWDGHPCCAFSCSREFADTLPNTYGNLLKALIDATQYASDKSNRKEISKAIAPKNYLNQPVPVVEQVMTGRFADGLGNVLDVPDRIDFDPFPWHSMGVWILTQMKRWGYIEGDVDYNGIAEQVYLTSDCASVMKQLGMEVPDVTYKSYTIMNKKFDPAEPEAYAKSFAITRA